MKLKDIGTLIAALIVTASPGFIGSFATMPAVDGWYTTLTTPALNPPSWVFGPVWTTLYALMGIALYLLWQKRHTAPRKVWRRAIVLFGIQLVLNALWSIIFFGLQNPGAALIEIALLWLAIVATIQAARNVSKPTAWLLAPYLAWVSFAMYLNAAIWVLN